MTFNNPELQKIYDTNRIFLEERIARIDRISEEIKALESVLSSHAVQVIKITDGQVSLSWQPEDKKIYLHLPSEEPRRFIEAPAIYRHDYADLLVDLLKA